jgi:hypothetical protein
MKPIAEWAHDLRIVAPQEILLAFGVPAGRGRALNWAFFASS